MLIDAALLKRVLIDAYEGYPAVFNTSRSQLASSFLSLNAGVNTVTDLLSFFLNLSLRSFLIAYPTLWTVSRGSKPNSDLNQSFIILLVMCWPSNTLNEP